MPVTITKTLQNCFYEISGSHFTNKEQEWQGISKP